MPAFSVIVPVYNAEKTLRRCLESLRAQTEPDFEVLMVENGSSDRSNAICREFTQQDHRFMLIEVPFGCGPSGARNIGLDQASGEWVAFVDSDDHVETEFLQCIYATAADTDAVFFGYRRVNLAGEPLEEHLPRISPDAHGVDVLIQLHQQDLFGYTCVKAFRREYIGDHRFSRELNLMEDEVFACEVLSGDARVAVLPVALYNYVTGSPGSMVGRTHPDYCRKADTAYLAWKQLLSDQPNKGAYIAMLADRHVRQCMYYGFERNVNPDCFFTELLHCSFFQEATINDKFCTYLRAGKLKKLRHMRMIYRIKMTLAKWIRH